MNNRLPERPTPRARHPERGSYRESLVVVGGARPLAHPGRGLGAVVVPTGPTYANSVCDVLWRRVVTSDGFWPVKKLRVLEEASWVVVGRGRRSRPGPVQSALEGRIATHGSLYARSRAASGSSARFAQGPGETRSMSQSHSEIPRPRFRRRKRHISASRRRYKEETGRSASIDWSALEDVAAVPEGACPESRSRSVESR